MTSFEWYEIALAIAALMVVMKFPAICTLTLLSPALADVARLLMSKPIAQVKAIEWLGIGAVFLVGSLFYATIKLLRGDIQLSKRGGGNAYRESLMVRHERELRERWNMDHYRKQLQRPFRH